MSAATRHAFRSALFARRGMAPERAAALADRLTTRDTKGDDRRMCIECKNLAQGGSCFRCKGYSADPLGPVRNPVADLLQRCNAFEWQVPA